MVFHSRLLLGRLQSRQRPGRKFFLSHIYSSHRTCVQELSSSCIH